MILYVLLITTVVTSHVSIADMPCRNFSRNLIAQCVFPNISTVIVNRCYECSSSMLEFHLKVILVLALRSDADPEN